MEVLFNTSYCISWHRSLRRNPFISISLGIFYFIPYRTFIHLPKNVQSAMPFLLIVGYVGY